MAGGDNASSVWGKGLYACRQRVACLINAN